eukprot:7749173-Alexandrium_andersonii.AAC.1
MEYSILQSGCSGRSRCMQYWLLQKTVSLPISVPNLNEQMVNGLTDHGVVVDQQYVGHEDDVMQQAT